MEAIPFLRLSHVFSLWTFSLSVKLQVSSSESSVDAAGRKRKLLDWEASLVNDGEH